MLHNTLDPSKSIGIGEPTLYDANGNRRIMSIGPNTYAYEYVTNGASGTNKIRNRFNDGSDEYVYDANANVIAANSKSLSQLAYDPFKQLTSFINEDNGNYMSFQYGGNKQRVLKREQVGESPVPNASMYIHGMNDYPLTEKYNEHSNIQDRMYIYGPTGLLAMVQDGISFYFIKDHLGSVRAVMNSSNALSSLYHYTPFGDSWATVLNRPSDYQFTGQELDQFSNGFSLHNFRARLYDSDLGRFYAMDPSGEGNSPYAYVANNPVHLVDPSGRYSEYDVRNSGADLFPPGTYEWDINQIGRDLDEAYRKYLMMVDKSFREYWQSLLILQPSAETSKELQKREMSVQESVNPFGESTPADVDLPVQGFGGPESIGMDFEGVTVWGDASTIDFSQGWFMTRPLRGFGDISGSLIQNPLYSEFNNTFVWHEQYFNESGWNRGFFGDSQIRRELGPFDKYAFESVNYWDAIIQVAINYSRSQFTEYSLGRCNCQHWADFVKQQYYQLLQISRLREYYQLLPS